jgi:16S rRNA processing protein RimM
VAERSEESSTQRVCVGAIAGAHGVRGAVRIKTFTEQPAALADYPGLADEQGRPVRFKIKEVRADLLIAVVEGVNDREAARSLKGTRLYVPRDELPAAGEEEYYHADLVGLAVERIDGNALGTVKAMHDFGAGDILEVATKDGTLMLPFTREAVPVVDIANRRLVVDPPAGLPGLAPEEGS